jgi:hypothetical protein
MLLSHKIKMAHFYVKNKKIIFEKNFLEKLKKPKLCAAQFSKIEII